MVVVVVVVVVIPQGGGPCLSPPCALCPLPPQGGAGCLSPLSPKVPLHDDWTHEVGHRCPAIKRPSSPMFIDMAQLETTAPPFVAGHKVENDMVAFLQFPPANNNVMKYKYIPTAADGESGIRFRMMLDMKNAREARRKARRLNERTQASYAGQEDTQPNPQAV